MPEDTTRPSDLDRMNREELLDLRKQIDRAIETVEKRHRDEAIAKARAAAEEHGFKLEELVAPGKTTGGKKASGSAPKYRHPENPETTWSGRGRQPNWVKEHLAAGRDLDDLKI